MNGAGWEMAELMAQLPEGDTSWECAASLRAPGRASGRELTPRRIRVRPAARSAGNECTSARVDVRTDARTFEAAGLLATAAAAACCRSTAEDYNNASVCHPHGEAIRPGAHEASAGREKHAPGGTRSPSSFHAELQSSRDMENFSAWSIEAC
jgi:hypothetical protein